MTMAVIPPLCYNAIINKRRNMSKDTLEMFKELYEIIKLNKRYIELLEKRVELLEKGGK